MVASHAAVARSSPAEVILRTNLYYASGALGVLPRALVLPMTMGGATSQLYLLSLTPLSVAGVVDCN